MLNTLTSLRPVVFAAMATSLLCLISAGCATKKYVGTRVAPLDQKISELEGKDQKTDAAIASIEQNVSRVDERAQAADRRAGEAANAAAQANEAAQQSGAKAEQAERAAADVRSALDQRSSELEQRLAAIDNFQLIGKEVVLFASGKARLDAEAKRQLDAAVGTISAHKRYVLEVQGFTDKTGPVALNLELSRQRAQEVVRYLTLQHKIPLHRIHVLGMGNAAPVADDKTREGRKLNRRVEVRLFSADPGAGKSTTARASGQ